jgi:arsenate reductase
VTQGRARIEPAVDADLEALEALLAAVELPTVGLREHLSAALVAREGDAIVGCVALERYGTRALLRSLAVAPARQHEGLGRRLTAAALDLARQHHVTALYLLTTTAARFFIRHFGFRAVARSEVPIAVQQSIEFAGACPATAQAMALEVPPGTAAGRPVTVVFACVHNAGRSQMAAAFFNVLADPARARAVSAGTAPAMHVHPEVVSAMREGGIDLAPATPRLLTPELAARAQLLVTMGCGEACPHVPGLAREDWPLADPKGQPPDRVRAIRDEIRGRVHALVDAGGWGRAR